MTDGRVKICRGRILTSEGKIATGDGCCPGVVGSWDHGPSYGWARRLPTGLAPPVWENRGTSFRDVRGACTNGVSAWYGLDAIGTDYGHLRKAGLSDGYETWTLWDIYGGPRDTATDGNNCFFPASHDLWKVAPDKTVLWQKTPSSAGELVSVASDGSGCLVGGTREGSPPRSVWKFDSAGNEKWFQDTGDFVSCIVCGGAHWYVGQGHYLSTKTVVKVASGGSIAWQWDSGGRCYELFVKEPYLWVAGERTNTWPGSGGAYANFWKLDVYSTNVIWAYDAGDYTGYAVASDGLRTWIGYSDYPADYCRMGLLKEPVPTLCWQHSYTNSGRCNRLDLI